MMFAPLEPSRGYTPPAKPIDPRFGIALPPEKVPSYFARPVSTAPPPTAPLVGTAVSLAQSYIPGVGRPSPPAPQIQTIGRTPPSPITPTKTAPPPAPIIAKQDMGFLSSIASKLAPKLVAATTIGGSKSSRAVLKASVSNPVFQPVYDKFGKDFETGAKIAATIATVAGAPLLSSVIKKGTGPLSVSPAPSTSTPTLGPLAATAKTEQSGSMPAWLLPVAIAVGVLLMFGKKLLR